MTDSAVKQKKNRDSSFAERIRSILRFHILLLDSPLTGLELRIAEEYESLMDFEEDPHPGKLGRIVSVLTNHELLFGSGYMLDDKEVPNDVAMLIDYVVSFYARDHRHMKPSAILPRNLGLSFLRKGLGAPLFGLHRPSVFPREPGFLICYQGLEADGNGRLAAVRMDDRTRCEYRGLGIQVDSRASWLHALLLPSDTMPILTPRAAFSRSEPTVFLSNNYRLFLSARKYMIKVQEEVHNPFYYQYAYFFYASADVSKNIGRFLRNLLVAMFTFSEKEAEQASLLFIQRLL